MYTRPFAKVTPVHTCGTIDRMMSDAEWPVELFFKCETFQKGGAFKFRGGDLVAAQPDLLPYCHSPCTSAVSSYLGWPLVP